jgi:hypothetical protein
MGGAVGEHPKQQNPGTEKLAPRADSVKLTVRAIAAKVSPACAALPRLGFAPQLSATRWSNGLRSYGAGFHIR